MNNKTKRRIAKARQHQQTTGTKVPNAGYHSNGFLARNPGYQTPALPQPTATLIDLSTGAAAETNIAAPAPARVRTKAAAANAQAAATTRSATAVLDKAEAVIDLTSAATQPSPSTIQRATCPSCNKTQKVTKAGLIGKHGDCAGNGQPVS